MLENVIPSSDQDLETMTKEVGVKPVLINSNLFSAQERERYYWCNFKIPELPLEPKFTFQDIMQHNVAERYLYNKEFKLLDMNKRVCGELLVNTTEMCKRIYNPKFSMATLTCINGGYQEKKILDNGRPRKLTEVEYERLQTLPDNFTKVLVNGKELSYSKRCSLCGNGWNKETVKHVFRGLFT
jgi:DNA (cytosine-5)-methyltransferase 3A